MNDKAILLLYNELKKTYDVGSLDDFKNYLMDDNKKEMFFNQVIKPEYDVDNIETFNEVYGLKKKDESDFITQDQSGELVTEDISSDIQPQTEQDFFEGTFGDVLRGFDAVTKTGLGDFVDDMARSAATGYYQGQVAEDASDILLRGADATDEDIYSFIEANKEAQKLGPSDEMMEYQKTYEENGKGFMGVVMGLYKSGFQVIPEVILSSITSMATNKDSLVAGGTILGAGATVGAGSGAIAGGVGAVPGAIAGAAATLPYAFAAAGSVLEMGATFSELLQEEIEGELTPEKIREALNDDKIYTSLRNKALARGITIGVIDAFTGRLAGKVAGKILSKAGTAATKGTKIKSVLAASGVESVGGSVGEATARGVIGQEMDISEIALEGIAEAPGGIKDVISARFSKPKYKVNGKKVDVETIDNLIETMTLDQLQSTKITIDNDYEGRSKKLSDRILQLNTERLILDANPDINPETLSEITKLQLELSSLEGNKTEVAKEKASIIKAKIKDLQENQLEAEVDTEVDAFRELEQSEQLKYIEQASKELVEESEAKGDEEFEITEAQSLQRAVELFNKDQQTETTPEAEDSNQMTPKEIIDERFESIKARNEAERKGDNAEVERQIKRTDYLDSLLDQKTKNRLAIQSDLYSKDAVNKKIEELKNDPFNFSSDREKIKLLEEVLEEYNKIEALETKKQSTKDTAALEDLDNQIEEAKQKIKSYRKFDKISVDPAPKAEVKAEIKSEPEVDVEVDDEVVYEMNKTNKKIWSKDFEILDNRQGQEEALFDEEGNRTSDKWWVVNKVTGEIVEVGTKSMAKDVIANAPAYAETFGEGTKVEANMIITPAPAPTPKAEVKVEEEVEVTTEGNERVNQVVELSPNFREDNGEVIMGGISVKVEDLLAMTDNQFNDFVKDITKRFKLKTPATPQKPRKQVTKVEKQVDNARKALNKLDKDIKIVIHNDDASYRKATGEETREQSTRGEYNPTTKTININATKVQDNTVAHEVFHALLLRNGITNKQAKAITDRMLNAVKKTASPELLQKLKEHSENYKSALQSEESIAELFGILASEYKSLDKPTQNLIQRWVNKLAKILGVNKFTDAEVIDLLNVVSAKVEAGQEITEQDVAILDGSVSGVVNGKARKQDSVLTSFTLKRFPTNPNIKLSEDTPLSNFNQKKSNLLESDRMTGAFIADAQNNPVFKFFGGIYFPQITGKWWASRTISKATSIAENMNANRDKDGYIYATPIIMKPNSHMSNQDMFETVWEFMKFDLRSKSSKVTKKLFSEYLTKALTLKSVNLTESDLNIKKSDNIETMITKLNKVLLGDDTTLSFEKRKAIIKAILGDPKVTEDRKFPTAGSISEVASKFEEEKTKQATKLWDIVMLMRTKGTLSTKITPKSDEFYHKSYPAEISSDQEIEVFFLDGAYNIDTTYPELNQSSGKVFSWKEYSEKHPSAAMALSQYGRTAKLSKASGNIVAPQSRKQKTKSDILKTLKEGQKLPTKPKQTKNKNGSITSGKVHLYHSTNGVENLNNILENGIDFEKQKAVGGLFFSKLGSPYRQDDSFVVIETDIENIPFNQRTEGQEVALGQLSDYKIVHSSKMSPRELKALSSLEMILNRKTNGGVEGYEKSLQNYKKRNKNSELVKYLEDAPQSRKQKPSKKPSKKPARKRTSSIKNAITEIKNVLNITPDEQRTIFKALNDQKKIAKDIKKDIVASLRELTKQGKITPSKMVSVINKVPDDFNNPITVERFVEYMTKVFNDADYGNKMMIANAKKGKARKNASTKLGIAEGLVDQLQRLFSVKPSLIPDSVLDQYMELIGIFGKRESVLSLPPMEQVIQLTEDVLQQLDEEQSMAIELADRYENADKVMGDDGVDYAATIKQMLDNEVITEREYEVMKKYKSEIKPTEPATPKTKEEIEAERQGVIEDIKETKEVDPSVFPSRLERDLAKRFKKLLKTDAVNDLSLDDLKNLFKVIDNINNGYLPHYAQIMVGKMNAINDARVGTNAINRSKLLPLSKIYANLKSKFGKTGKTPTLELIRRNPTFYIDQVFGDFKTKDIFNSIFKRSAEASAKYTKAIKEVQAKIEKVEQAVFKSFGRDPNKVIMSKYKQMSYLIQQEFLSNPDSKQVNSVEDFLKATIKRIKTETTSYTETDAKMLQDILDKYTANGTKSFDIDQLYESFNVAERNSIRALEEINKSMTERAVYTANIIRGNKITPLKNYTHLSVIPDVSKSDIIETETSQISDMFNKYLKPSTKAKSLIERTGKVSPLNFDVYASVQRGAKYTLMDFNLTEPIRTARRTINQIEKNLADQDGNIPVNARRKFNAIRDASVESIENLLSNALTQNTIFDEAVDYIQKQGYRAILAGVPRASYELLSNILAGIFIDPKGIISGIKNRKLLASPEGKEVMNNLNSTQTNRVFSTGLSGKFVDTGILNQAAGVTASRAKGRVKNTILKLWNKSGQRWVKGVEFTADSLISSPDKLVMQPMWFGAFENRFKQLTGKSPDFDKIAANDEAYMNKYETELNDAKTLADNRSVAMGATDNAFMGILKGTVKPNQGVMLRGFNAFNGFMTRFLIFEYITARTGIMAAVGNGQVSKKQGAALLAGVTTRMIAYTFMGTLVAESIKGLTEDDEEEDYDMSDLMFEDDDEQGMKSVDKMLGQAMASAFTSLLLGRDFGNATKSIINYGIEDFNERYGQFLRDGEYDKYRDAIQYTIIPEGKSGRPAQFADIAPNLFAAYSPMLKTLEFGVNKLFESDRVKPDAIERQQDERFIRLPLETFGVLGFIPFYKDVRKIVLANMYKGLRKAKKDAANKKKRKAEMLQGYSSETDMKRYDFPLWEKTFGPDSPGYDKRQAEKELKRKERKLRQQKKDKMYDYTPPVSKRKKQSSPFGPSGSRKGSSPFGPN
jgi:hypothetical protein